MTEASRRGLLVVSRAPARGRDMFRSYVVYVDNKPRAKLRRGTQARIELALGKHTVWLGIDWCTSPELGIEITPGSEVILNCGPNPSSRGAFNDVAKSRNDYIWLRSAQ